MDMANIPTVSSKDIEKCSNVCEELSKTSNRDFTETVLRTDVRAIVFRTYESEEAFDRDLRCLPLFSLLDDSQQVLAACPGKRTLVLSYCGIPMSHFLKVAQLTKADSRRIAKTLMGIHMQLDVMRKLKRIGFGCLPEVPFTPKNIGIRLFPESLDVKFLLHFDYAFWNDVDDGEQRLFFMTQFNSFSKWLRKGVSKRRRQDGHCKLPDIVSEAKGGRETDTGGGEGCGSTSKLKEEEAPERPERINEGSSRKRNRRSDDRSIKSKRRDEGFGKGSSKRPSRNEDFVQREIEAIVPLKKEK